jgi:hypothetical protein
MGLRFDIKISRNLADIYCMLRYDQRKIYPNKTANSFKIHKTTIEIVINTNFSTELNRFGRCVLHGQV